MKEEDFIQLNKYEEILYKAYTNKLFTILKVSEKNELSVIYKQITGYMPSGCCFKDYLYRLAVWYFDYKQKNKTYEQGAV